MISTIYLKEIRSFFRSPMAYIIAGLFALIMGWMFFNQLVYFADNVQKLPLNMRHEYDFANQVIVKLFGSINFILLFMTPILAMKSFSEELRDGTIELYYSSPVSDLEVIFGKYFALITKGAFLISTTFILPIFLGKVNVNDYSFVISGYLGLWLNFCCFAALSMFASSLTKNQVLAAIIAFVLVLFSWMFAMFSQMSDNYLLSEIYKYLSVNHHFENLAKGKLILSDFIFYISFISFILVALRVRMKARRW